MVSKTLIEKAREFHGHICPYVVLGLRASEIAMQRLNIKKASEAETVNEDIIAIVECNNCFADGVQVATGCTFGNNGLIYMDTGKNAVTLVRRRDWKGIRVYVDSEKMKKRYFSEEASRLFEKVIARREGTSEDQERLRKLWNEIGFALRDAPEEIFKIEEVKISPVERAPIFETVKCDLCGELVMKTRAKVVNGKTLCQTCAGSCNAVVGRGIVLDFKTPFEKRL
ncbi:FmdE family protein [Fervidicoccus fontis]|uniref:Formylmethanofuran dehydrogenase, subunit E region n=1 Tax=Fervidicoccus fontis (strain DSM 19380 / JCM 18336 / VKM B-2539 / Kam940) TaxID=1163730 RepID=I0A2W1_FERFK|nr:FmdE family protein [Fervidicoccus fontis]AFH43318.1 formylmethanofuran dehydrogenase, subunit E region [Fervidicoccus fontis Kam940]